MIVADQPTIFGDDLVVGVSSINDGNMSFGRGNEIETFQNRLAFLRQTDIEATQATLVQVSYEDTTDFARYVVVDDSHQGEGMLSPVSSVHADALIAARPDQALFLPLADCIGAILYDPVNRILMVSHLGRHSIEDDGGQQSVAYLVDAFDCNPADVQVWLSPAAGGDNYPLRSFDGRSLHDVATSQLISAGVKREHIEVSPVDTTEHDQYYSHSAYLAGRQATDGRFAIIAMMREE